VTNLLGNPGFEDPLGSSPGNSDNTANRGITRVTTNAPVGNAFLRLDEGIVAGQRGHVYFPSCFSASRSRCGFFQRLARAYRWIPAKSDKCVSNSDFCRSAHQRIEHFDFRNLGQFFKRSSEWYSSGRHRTSGSCTCAFNLRSGAGKRCGF